MIIYGGAETVAFCIILMALIYGSVWSGFKYLTQSQALNVAVIVYSGIITLTREYES